MTRPTVSLVVAVARNGVIGRDGGLPWRLPDDLAYFKRVTLGHHIVMGRKTWASIGRPLPGRTSLVLSRDPAFVADGAQVVRTLDEARARTEAAGDDEMFVIGGAQVYAAALPHADRIHWTAVDADADGDVWFPPLEGTWEEVSRAPHPPDERHRFGFVIRVLERAAKR